MWNWLNCYLSGRHDFGVTCASGAMFLRCIHCGKRSNGWAVHNEPMLATIPIKRMPPPSVRAPFSPRAVDRQHHSA